MDYSDSIEMVRDFEAIRMRPAMYVGEFPKPQDRQSISHEEALCLSLDEAACGNCTEVAISWGPSEVCHHSR